MTADRPRYVIARQVRGEYLAGPVVPVLDLPDAEHIHLTRHPDGTWTAVPMVVDDCDCGRCDDPRGHHCFCSWKSWVDEVPS